MQSKHENPRRLGAATPPATARRRHGVTPTTSNRGRCPTLRWRSTKTTERKTGGRTPDGRRPRVRALPRRASTAQGSAGSSTALADTNDKSVYQARRTDADTAAVSTISKTSSSRRIPRGANRWRHAPVTPRSVPSALRAGCLTREFRWPYTPLPVASGDLTKTSDALAPRRGRQRRGGRAWRPTTSNQVGARRTGALRRRR